ncbi:MAG: PocR ligand-binding domain-containing protein [Acidobacteriota bacterium]|nr:PocR ligand-binding domain-containing protein [Acidobacteriota bacterium]
MKEENPDCVEWTPTLRTELLDPESWEKVLGLYARSMKLAVALIDTEGRLMRICHNPQPIWSLVHEARPDLAGGCLFCLEITPNCSAAADALLTGELTVTRDQAGFAHVALPLTLGDRHVGTLLAGQVLDRYPEPLPLQRLAREFGLSPQQLWHLARQRAPLNTELATVNSRLNWKVAELDRLWETGSVPTAEPYLVTEPWRMQYRMTGVRVTCRNF